MRNTRFPIAALIVLLLSVACGEHDAPSGPESPVLAGEFARPHAEDRIVVRDLTLEGQPFGDSALVRVTGEIRDGSTILSRKEIAAGANVSGTLQGICIDTNPRQCAVGDLYVD